MKKIILLQLFIVLLMGYSCKKDDLLKNPQTSAQSADDLTKKMYDQYNSGHIKIAVVSDIHFMDQSLIKNNGENGAAYKS